MLLAGAIAWVLVGVVAAVAWVDFEHREHFAIFGPTRAGRACGFAAAFLLVVVLWPAYWRARAYWRRHDGRPGSLAR